MPFIGQSCVGKAEGSLGQGADKSTVAQNRPAGVFIEALTKMKEPEMLRRIAILPIFFVLLLSTALAQKTQEPAAPEKTIAIHAARLIDGTSPHPRHDVLIVVKGNKIASVSEGGKPPAEAEVINLPSNVTVLPGLIDTHTHIFLQGEDPAEGGYDIQLLKYPASFRAARATVSARRCLEQGFTTIRDVETEGAGYGDLGIKMAINKGYIPGPRIFASTRAISVTGGYPLEGYNPDIVVPKGAQLADGSVELRKAAREQLENGADWIKVYMTHRSWVDKQGHLVSQPTKPTASSTKWRATPMVELGCIALWMAVAIPLSTALIWMMMPSRKCSGKARGWYPLWRFITTTGRLRTHRRASATARVRQSMKFRSKKLLKPA
jgi:Amidohydrolase family